MDQGRRASRLPLAITFSRRWRSDPTFCAKLAQPAIAGDSIKPGAQAPGKSIERMFEPAIAGDSGGEAVAGVAGSIRFSNLDPGAYAPGFMLSPAIAG